jgi:hypothetical protein
MYISNMHFLYILTPTKTVVKFTRIKGSYISFVRAISIAISTATSTSFFAVVDNALAEGLFRMSPTASWSDLATQRSPNRVGLELDPAEVDVATR